MKFTRLINNFTQIMRDKKRHYFLKYAIPLALLFWIFDSMVHYFWYGDPEFELIPSNTNDLWMRRSVIFLLIAFGLFADYQSRKSITRNLAKYRADNISRAKKQWELAVDSLPQLVIAMDHNARIFRVNRTAEAWGISRVEHANGLHLSDLINSLTDCHTGEYGIADWRERWRKIESEKIQTWQVAQNNAGRAYQYTLKRISDYDPNKDQFYAVLIIEDITALQNKEASLKRHAQELEKKVNERTLELKLTNTQLEQELEIQNIAKQELRKSQECRLELLRDLITAQEKERKRIACELHDSIGQSLGATKFKVEELLLDKSNDFSENSKSQLKEIVDYIKNVIHEVRHIAMDLRPAMLDDLGALITLKWFCREFEKTYTNITVLKTINVNETDIPEDRKVVIFRIVQEAMNNIVKHAHASKITLELSKSDSGLNMYIKDDGCGFDIDPAKNSHVVSFCSTSGLSGCRFGMSSMRERAESTGGIFSIKSSIGEGTCVSVFWED